MTLTPGGRRTGARFSSLHLELPPLHKHPMASALITQTYPVSTNNRSKLSLPDAWDQGDQGSCVAHAFGRAALPFWSIAVPSFMPSRQFLYNWARIRSNELDQDEGCETADMIAVLQGGVYDEQLFAYSDDNLKVTPPDGQHPFMIGQAYPITTKDALCSWIAAGNLVPFVMDLPDDFEAEGEGDGPDRGVIVGDTGSIGWHAMCGEDYDGNYIIACNSWNSSWGINGGRCRIPINTILNSARGGGCWALLPADNM